MSPVEWSAVGIIVTVNLAGLGYLARQIARLDTRLDRLDGRIDRLEERFDARFDRVEEKLERLEERYIQHLEHHARFA